ncbi:blue copper protein-like [Rutidosis leptorrhynchoides]|uniref:blue copper protein-like n=1 Tax=Rutidosis leptorrhynchoides TaxID=125765 RepID=UPI003A99A385
MANKYSIVLFISLVAALATSISATTFIVGDDYGWTLNFDYQAWAKGKKFVVGDKIVFKYPIGKHNVFKVDGPSFQKCIVPAANASFTTGYDVITLTTPGRKWYICGVGKHCEYGMKLVIDVVIPQWTPSPPPTVAAPSLPAPVPSSSPSGNVFMVGDYSGWTLNFDYQAWAMGKKFVVGDKLVFKYPKGVHNVYKLVNGTDFQKCSIPSNSIALTSGYDVVTLATPGRKWYICGVGKHCQYGMKLVIDVVPQWTPPAPSLPAPVPSSSSSGNVFTVGDYNGWILNFDYQAWAMGKKFVVGDKLVFKYPKGVHNVYKLVNGTDFQKCAIPSNSILLSSGYDVVTLMTPGRKWYVCGVGKHCETGGMKLVIDVVAKATSPWSSSTGARKLGGNIIA